MATKKLNKTETKIMDDLERWGRVSTCNGNTSRYNKALVGLIKKGLLKEVSRASGMFYSNHGLGKNRYTRPNYTVTITAVGN